MIKLKTIFSFFSDRMEHKTATWASIVFFLIINTSYFWEKWLGNWSFPFVFVLIAYYLILALVVIRISFWSIREKLKNKARIPALVIIYLILIVTFIKPVGLINFDSLNGYDLLVAGREGAAGCTYILKLKDNNSFISRNVCFGTTVVNGKYFVRMDTIFFMI